MSDLNLAQCTPSKYYDEINLSIPSSCSAGHDLQYSFNHFNHKGPFLNSAFSSVPSSAISIKPRQSLSDLSDEDIPEEWSWRTEGGEMIEDGSRNQGSCGCCWAVAFVSALGDRYAIKYKINAPYPSAMWMISCGGSQIGSKGSMGNGSFPANIQCSCGGSIYGAAKWLDEGNSIGNEKCWPFSSISNNVADDRSYIAPNCPNVEDNCCFDCCGNPESKNKFTIEKGSVKLIIVPNQDDDKTANVPETIRAIKLDIKNNGPVATTFTVPIGFTDWWNKHKDDDIYIPTTPNIKEHNEGGHAVVLTGWGIDHKGNNYWEVRNSWGKPGFCRFIMSTDIDQEYWTGIDIAQFSNGSWQGGPVSVMPGDLSDEDKKQRPTPSLKPSRKSKPTPEPTPTPRKTREPTTGKTRGTGSKQNNKIKRLFQNFNWKVIGIIVIVIFILLILISFIF
jgi:hypothetical protein